MGSVYRPTRLDPATGKRLKYKTYRIAYVNELGRRVTEKAYRDKTASEALLRQRERNAERARAGLPVAQQAAGAKPMSEVVNAYLSELERKGSSPDQSHWKESKRILEIVAKRCGWQTLSAARPPTSPPTCTAWPRRATRPHAEPPLGSRARFFNWCVNPQKWLEASPIQGTKPVPVGQAGRRRKRRPYTAEELGRLLAVTPEPRRTLYLVAALSGYRRSELRRMEKQDVAPEGDKPRWQLRAARDKSGKCHTVPMLPDVRPTVLALWKNLPKPTSRLFTSVARMNTFHSDLERANIPRQDDQGRWADFHSFRYTFCLLGTVMPIQKVKVLMRHSTIKLTADLYTDLGIEDLGAEVWNLPKLVDLPGEGKQEQQPDKP